MELIIKHVTDNKRPYIVVFWVMMPYNARRWRQHVPP